MFNFVRALLASLVLFSGGAFADNYSWRAATFTGDSPISACTAYLSSMNYYAPFKVTKHAHYENQFDCWGMSPRYHELGANGFASRSGDSCPAGSVYNAETGECVPPPSQCEAGQSSSFEFLYCYNYDGGNGCSAGTSTGRPGSFCRNSCEYIPDYNPSTTDADCYAYQNGDGPSGPAVMCSVSAETNGSECSGDYMPDTPDNSCPSGTVSGQLNGKNVCIPSGGGGDTGGGDTGGGDTGGGDTGGGDTGGGNTGGGNTGGGDNGGGDSTGTGGTGTGGTGTGGTGTGGDGDGDGDGSGSAEGVENCAAGRCDFGDERGDPFGGDVRSFADSLTAAMSGMKNSPLGSSIGNIQFPTGGTCPTGSTSIATPFGSMSIDFESHCTLWEQIAPILSAVFLAFWAILAVRVFLSA